LTKSRGRPIIVQVEALKDKKVGCVLIFLFAFLLRVGFYFLPREPNPDAYIILELADNFFKSGYQVLGEPHTMFMPVLPLLISILHIAGLPSIFAGRVLSLAASSLLPVLVFIWPDSGNRGSLARFLGALIACFFGLDLIESSYISTEIIFALFVMLGFLAFIKDRFFLAGLVLGIGFLSRPEAGLAFLAAAIFLWAKPGKILWLGLGFILAASPWLTRNWLVFGRPDISLYMTDLANPVHSGPRFLYDILRGTGPLILIFSLLGLVWSGRREKRVFSLYFVFYFALHLFWWFTNPRFAEPLVPLLSLLSGSALVQVLEKLKKRSSKAAAAMALIISAVFLEQLVMAATWSSRLLHAKPDPFVQACKLLTGEQSGKVLSSGPLVAKFQAGLLGLNLMDFKPGDDPHNFVLDKVLKDNARYFIWDSSQLYDFNYFHYLYNGDQIKVMVNSDSRRFELSYDFYRIFRSGNWTVYIYELSAKPAG